MAVKWIFESGYKFSDKMFARIYSFYVLETPVPGVSVRGKSFKQRGWNMNQLIAAMKKESPFLNCNWFVKPIKEIESVCREEKIFDNVDFSKEIAIHTENSKYSLRRTASLFYAIRCAFAHGGFSIHKCSKERYYLLENFDAGRIKARLVLKEETLIKWIEIVEKGTRK